MPGAGCWVLARSQGQAQPRTFGTKTGNVRAASSAVQPLPCSQSWAGHSHQHLLGAHCPARPWCRCQGQALGAASGTGRCGRGSRLRGAGLWRRNRRLSGSDLCLPPAPPPRCPGPAWRPCSSSGSRAHHLRRRPQQRLISASCSSAPSSRCRPFTFQTFFFKDLFIHL